MDSNQRSATSMVVTPHRGDHSLSVEKEIDEISATGGHRFLSPIDVNDVLSPCSMFAAKTQDLVVLDRENLSNSTRVGWLDR